MDGAAATAFEPALLQAPAADLHDLLRALADRGGSDLHVGAGGPPWLRVCGHLAPLPCPDLTEDDARRLCCAPLTATQRRRLDDDGEVDFAFDAETIGRIRGNVYVRRGGMAAAFRLVPASVPRLETLGLPGGLADLARLRRGLVLVTGATGSGKSTTLAALVDAINRERRVHVVTIEDPIEFVHVADRALITQREVNGDTASFAAALRHVLRQDPDVVLIGEMRDRETVAAALTLAETGHLVLSTLHAASALQTVTRIVDVFAAEQQAQVRTQLSLVLEAAIAQQLVPHADGSGRAVAAEVLLPNPAVRALIRDEKVHQIYSQMQAGQARSGMQTMSQSLADLCRRGVISPADAMAHATQPDELRRLLASGEFGVG